MATFANPWSKILLSKKFEEQFYIPVPISRLEKGILTKIESFLTTPDILDIKIEKPIFIIGLPRSGTSFLNDILTSHQDATYVSHLATSYFETPLAAEWVRKKFNLGVSGERFFKDSVQVDINSAAEPFMHWGKWFSRDVASLYWNKLTMESLGEEKVKEIKYDIKKIIYSFNKKNPRFVCKFATIQPEVELLNEIFPDAKFINIVRDGRAVAHSLLKLYQTSNDQLKKIKHPLLKHIYPYPRTKNLQHFIETYGGDSIECTAHIWKEGIEYLEEIRPNLNHYYEFRYEDFIAEPAKYTKELFEFCEMSTPDTPKFTQLYNGIGKVGHKNNYTESHVVEKICNEVLKKYSY